MWLLVGNLVVGVPPARAEKVVFSPQKDAYSFSNDTVREYITDERGEIVAKTRAKDDERARFAHCCFLLARSTAQFAKFAEFDPSAPKVSNAEYRRRILEIFHRSLWRSVPKKKIVIPGYANLWDFSKDYKSLLQDNMGSWRMTYMRVGNYRMGFPFRTGGQSLAARRLIMGIEKGDLQVVYLSKFPKMNHCVVIFDYRGLPGGDIEFQIYDPNYSGETGWLRYHAKERYFELQERWYYNRGRVNLMRVFLSPFH